MNQVKREELRKVIVSGNESWGIGERFGYFHGWASFARDGENGKDKWVSALVEFEDGKVDEVRPEAIKFVGAFDHVEQVASSN